MGKLSRIQKIAISLGMAVAFAAPFAFAQSGETGTGAQKDRSEWRGKRGGDRGGRGSFFKNLDLTDAQKAQMKQIRQNSHQSLMPLTKEIRAKRQEIHQANQDGSFNEALVARKLAELAPLEAKLMAERARVHQETLNVLTAEQKTKLEQSRQEMKAKRAERGARKGR